MSGAAALSGCEAATGNWRTDRQYIELEKGSGEIRSWAAVNPVMRLGLSGRAAVPVVLDGRPIGDWREIDLPTDGVARFDPLRLIRLVAGASPRRYVQALSSSDLGLRAYVLTFSPRGNVNWIHGD